MAVELSTLQKIQYITTQKIAHSYKIKQKDQVELLLFSKIQFTPMHKIAPLNKIMLHV
jgi:hypothetical protein